MDARQLRLDQYVESLRRALRDKPSPDERARLESRLAAALPAAGFASKRRVPRLGTSTTSLSARAGAPRTRPLARTEAPPDPLE